MSVPQRKKNECGSRDPTPVKQSKFKREPTIRRFSNQVVGGKNLSAIECEQLQLSNLHEKIQEIGEISMNEFVSAQKRTFNQLLEQKREAVKEQMDSQLLEMKQSTQSSVKSESEEELFELTDDEEEKFYKSILAAETDIKRKYEEKIKKLQIDLENKTSNSLLETEEYLKQKFRCIEEKYLVDLNEYYKQLMNSYRSQFECTLQKMMKEHDENYKKTNTSLENNYKNELDSAKLNLENKLLSKKTLNLNTEPSSSAGDTLKEKKKEYLEKVKKLEQRNQQIQYFEGKIESVLNNYMKMVSLKEQQSSEGTYGIDEKKLFEKYLGRPKVDFEPSIQGTDKECHF